MSFIQYKKGSDFWSMKGSCEIHVHGTASQYKISFLTINKWDTVKAAYYYCV